MATLADGLSVGRLLLAAAFPWALARGGWLPVAMFGFAAASDWFDGPLARRAAAASSYGGVLDNAADVAFVLAGTTSAAWLGLLSWVVPASIAGSSATYALASRRLSRGAPATRLARSRIGHAAGVCNYACVGIAATTVAVPGVAWGTLLAVAGGVTIAVNVGALASRWLPR